MNTSPKELACATNSIVKNCYGSLGEMGYGPELLSASNE